MSGGASYEVCLQEKVKELKQISQDSIATSLEGDPRVSLVAQGGILCLADPDISKDERIAKKSIGIVVSVQYDAANPVHRTRQRQAVAMGRYLGAGEDQHKEKELPETVLWRVKIGVSLELSVLSIRNANLR